MSGLMPSVRRAVDTVDPQLALAQVRTLQDMLDRASSQMAFTIVLLAIGAEPAGVSRMIVRQGALVALAGLAIGLAGALASSRLIESLLYGVSSRDPGVFATMAATLLAVALLAC